MTTRDPEYDRFGPWVLEITDEDPLPPRFVPHVARADDALVSVKIPRKIARREAHPGMDLYDFVVSLYEQDLVVLERIDTEVRERTIAYEDVKLLRVQEELLRGALHLGVPGNPYELPYNTVSSDVMQRVADLIEARFQPATGATVGLPSTPGLGELSFYFERLLKVEREGGSEMRPLAAQPETALGSLESSAARRLLFGIVDKRLLESVHLSDGRTLRIIDRGQPFAYRWQTVYGRRETLIPLANITDVTWATSDDRSTDSLTVHTAGGDSSWVFTRDTTGVAAYRDWLADLP